MEPDVALFRQIAPEFAEVADEEIALQIEFATDFLSEKRFGKFYAKALLYLAAHFMYKPPYGSGKLHIPGHTRTLLIYQGVAGFFVDK